jgi:hypothetical protein
MSDLSRRKLITSGLAAAAGVAAWGSRRVSRNSMDWSRPIMAESTAPVKR